MAVPEVPPNILTTPKILGSGQPIMKIILN